MVGAHLGRGRVLRWSGLWEPVDPRMLLIPSREFPLLPAARRGAGEMNTNRRQKRNGGRQRSGSDWHDTSRVGKIIPIGDASPRLVA
jgi:hypothetical protein